jgi:hypothetical protein
MLVIGRLNVWGSDLNRSSTGNSGGTVFQGAIDKVMPIDPVAINRHEQITRLYSTAVDRQTRHGGITILAAYTQALS